MTLCLNILPGAEQDAQHIFDHISKRSLQGASAWWFAFEDAFKTRHGRSYRFVFTRVGDELRILRVRGPGQPPLQADEMPDNE